MSSQIHQFSKTPRDEDPGYQEDTDQNRKEVSSSQNLIDTTMIHQGKAGSANPRFPLRDITSSSRDDVSKITICDFASVSVSTSISGSFDSYCTESTMQTAKRDEKQMRIEQQRHKLKGMVHASQCTHESQQKGCPCPNHRHCAAAKRLYNHAMNCQLPECFVPGCLKSRKSWSHFIRCKNEECVICVSIPPETRVEVRKKYAGSIKTTKKKTSRRRSPISVESTLSPTSSVCSYPKSPGRPPLSPNKPIGSPRKQLMMMEV
mmetsp:Transcript_20920/g.27039  ORF Transcript_20920/g.27039 Transcript_20920/m.27039 type:complete len:262 (+) Transcript_20920:159-944(+)